MTNLYKRIDEARAIIDRLIEDAAERDRRQAKVIIDLCNAFAKANWEKDYEDQQNQDWTR